MKTYASILTLSLAACGGDDGGDQPDAAPAIDGASIDERLSVTIPFAARIGGQPFACGTTYSGIGSAASDYVGIDFRFYVHDVALGTAGGEDFVAVELDVDGSQEDGLALLDFEDATGACEMGSPTTHTAITGKAASGAYDAIRFRLGVSPEMNHLDPAAPPAPLDQSGMSWAWQFGFKFVKIDGVVGGEGFNLHLGATGCPGDTPELPPTGTCANPNLPSIELPYTEGRTIVADVAAVFADVDVSANTPDSAPGCMSFPGDPECDTIFPKLGLPFGPIEAGTQELFSVE